MMLGLGVAAIIVGAIDVLFPLSVEMELLLWILLSILALALWFKYMKDNRIEPTGQSNYALDTQGVVVKNIPPNGRGEVKFDKPVLGNTTWFATSKEDINEGSRVSIVEVKGQLIEVKNI